MASADKAHVDPSALRRLYVHDDSSRPFCAWRARVGGSLPLTLHGKAELVNSIALAVFGGDISAAAGEAAPADLESDLAAGHLHVADLLWRSTVPRCGRIRCAGLDPGGAVMIDAPTGSKIR